jgi:hypothetical protein
MSNTFKKAVVVSLMKIDQEGLSPSLAPLWKNLFFRDLIEKVGWGSVSSGPAVRIEETAEAFEAGAWRSLA